MLRFLTLLVLALLGVWGLIGCGGSNVEIDNPDSGIYSAPYNRAGGKITVTVGKNSTVTVTIVDEAAGTYIGSGRLTSQESFSVNCVGPDGKSVYVDGSLKKSALSKNFVGKAKGSITFSYDAPLAVGSVSVSLFAGTYTGEVAMRNFDSYPFTAMIDSSGFITVKFTVSGTPVTMSGLVFSDGRVTLQPAEGQTLKYWGKGSVFMFTDLENLYINCSVSNKKDGPEIGTLRGFTPYYPG